MKTFKLTALAIIGSVLLSTSSFAVTYTTFTGTFSNANDVQWFWALNENSDPFFVITDSFASGGFDPVLFAFKADGSYITTNDDVDFANGDFDAKIDLNENFGTYYFALSVPSNSPTLDSGFFSGWDGNGSSTYFSGPSISPYDPDWSVNFVSEDDAGMIIGTPTFTSADFTPLAPAPVPEPSTFILLGAGLAGLAVWRKKRS